MGGEIDRPDWSEGDGTGSDRAGAGHEMQEAKFDERGRYSGSLDELEFVEEQEPANPLTVTEEERTEIVENIEARAEPPTLYEDLSEATRALFDEEGYEQVMAEIATAKELLTHEQYDDLAGAIDGLPKFVNEKVLTALSTGSFENVQELVEDVAQDLTAVQVGHLRRAISEMPAAIRDKIQL